MTATLKSFALAAFVRCQHSIQLGNFGRYCASVSPNLTKGEASLFPYSPSKLPQGASNWFKFWLLLFSHMTLPASEITTNAFATCVAGATFNASGLLPHLAHSSLYGAALVVWAEQPWPWSLPALVESCVFQRQSDASPAALAGSNRCSL